MLLRVILKNFLSFDNEVQFDMFPNMKRVHLGYHIYNNVCSVPILKLSGIFGANGSGKSNLVKALEFIRAFALDKDFGKRIDLRNFPYLLKETTGADPISLSIEFEHQRRIYYYEIEISEHMVEIERLSESFPFSGGMELIYERKNHTIKFSESSKVDNAIVDATKEMMLKNPLASLLALNGEFPIVPDQRCKFVSDWFKGQMVVIGVHSYLPSLIDLLRNDKNMLEFTKVLVNNLEVGVNSVDLVESDFEKWAQNHVDLISRFTENIDSVKSLSLSTNNAPIFSIAAENGTRKVFHLIFGNLGKGGFVGQLDTSSQSDGTLRALTLLPALYYACKLGKTVIVDEINCCLSSTMVKGIVEYFAKTQDTNGQLIFTTHDNQILDARDVLRSDEIWFVDKHEGASILYSHNDFKEHHTISPMRGYNEGRYGAIRFVNLLEGNGR